VGGAGGAASSAALGDVAVAGRRTALDGCRLERIVRAGGTVARAALRHVAVAGGGPALHGRRLEGVRRTLRRRAGTRLLGVARARGRARDRRRGCERVRRAGRVDTVARLGQVADSGRRAARHAAAALPDGCWHAALAPAHWPTVQGLPSSVRAVAAGVVASAGQLGPLPVQNSATSHSPAAARHWVVTGAKASTGQVTLAP